MENMKQRARVDFLTGKYVGKNDKASQTGPGGPLHLRAPGQLRSLQRGRSSSCQGSGRKPRERGDMDAKTEDCLKM